MDILAFAMRRLLASIGAVGMLAVRLRKLLSHLIFIEERRRSEHLRNESHEIQNIQAYEKLLAQHAKLMLTFGSSPKDVEALIFELMNQRLRAYLRLHAMPNAKSGLPSPHAEGEIEAREIKSLSMDRRLGERRHLPDRRRLTS